MSGGMQLSETELIEIGYTLLKGKLYKAAVDVFSDLQKPHLLNGTVNKISSDFIKIKKKLEKKVDDRKMSIGNYFQIINSYSIQQRYAEKREEEIRTILH